MEPVTVKKGKKEYVFHSDRIVITKKNKTIHEIYYNEIKEITYNPKFEFIDFINNLSGDVGSKYYVYNSFIIDTTNGKSIGIKLSKSDFEKVKEIVPIGIELV